jgi:hypothetical protein
MFRTFALLSLATGVLAPLPACLVPPPPTTITLVNETGLDVTPRLFVSGTATSADALFTDGNLVTDFTDRPFPELRRHETVTLTLECDEIQSLGVDAPILFDAARLIITQSGDRIFLLWDEDFECGATVQFVYFTEGDAFRVRVEYP